MTPWVILAAAVLVTFFGCGWGIEYRKRLTAEHTTARAKATHADALTDLAEITIAAELWRMRAERYHPAFVAETLRARAACEGIGGQSL